MEIKSNYISFVVQGPIFYDLNITVNCLKSIRKFFPDSEIVLSTWKSPNFHIDKSLYDNVLFNDDPGNLVFTLLNGAFGSDNRNRQIISTKNGLSLSSRKFIVKTRTDIIFKNNNLISTYINLSKKLSNFDPNFRFINHRVLTLPPINPTKLMPFSFNVCDWFFFGYAADVKNIWNIPLHNPVGPKINGFYLFKYNLQAEQYIWLSFINKFKNFSLQTIDQLSKDIISLSEKTIINNTFFANSQKIGLDWLKNIKGTYAALPQYSHNGLYTENEMFELYNKYAFGSIKIKSNFLETLIYKVNMSFRKTVKFNSLFYKFLVKIFRVINQSGPQKIHEKK